jgi:NADH:ubiquinone reductase (H+-translocating)
VRRRALARLPNGPSRRWVRALLLGVCVAAGVLAPAPALAHVKWFTDPTPHPLQAEWILSARTLLCAVTSALAVVVLALIRRKVGRRDWPASPLLGRMAAGAPTILAIQAAIGLVAAATRPALLAPNLPLGSDVISLGLVAMQLGIACAFITGLADWLAGLALIALVPLVAVIKSPADAFEQVLWAGIGTVVVIIGRTAMDGGKARALFERRSPAWAGRAVTALRIATGLSLVAVALGEKIWNPLLGRAFLLERPELNVFHNLLGVSWFSDDVFVLAAGLTEAAIGVMLISGILPRLVILGMWLPFHLGIPVLPPQEFIGHLPIFGIMYVLFVHGARESEARAPWTNRWGRPERRTRIVILGGGFAGVAVAEQLERVLGDDPSVVLTLISDSSTLVFTPLLAEVAAGQLEPSQIGSSLRARLKRSRVVRGRVTGIDLDNRGVQLQLDDGVDDVPFDHLVLALGSVANYHGMQTVAEEAFDFKTLEDAVRIRNHVIDLFERADHEPDPARRRALLTIVVAGGGFSGVELAGVLNDFTRDLLAYYPRISPRERRIILVHSRERILPELSAGLAADALKRLASRGVTFALNTRVADARNGVVVLRPGGEVRTETLIWTAGVAPNPLLRSLPVERDARGAVRVDRGLAVPGQFGVWALGDCASVTDARTGQISPPTAQFAVRQAAFLARNLHASLKGKPLEAFQFQALGTLCSVGHHAACAEIKGLRFSGFVAWLLWRAIYLHKLPGWERKLRVLGSWLIGELFPRDIVQTPHGAAERSPRDDRAVELPARDQRAS